jgi:hypothetical protein
MGKTFRRGGSEQGNYSPGKSIRDKRQKASTSRSTWAHENNQSKTNMGKRKKLYPNNNEW